MILCELVSQFTRFRVSIQNGFDLGILGIKDNEDDKIIWGF